MKRRKRRYEEINLRDFVAIVADGSIAGPIVEGSNIPLLILDTSERRDVEELIRVQAHLPPGDVRFRWGGSADDDDLVILVLDFDRPVEARVAIRFSIEHQGILVDAALQSHAVYIQAGREGDRLRDDLDLPKMIVELPETGFRPKWDQLLARRMIDVIVRRTGVDRKQAAAGAETMIAEMRRLTTFRMPRGQ
jgi:hypothetical protein